MSPENIARVCHEANRVLTSVLQDVPVQPPWDSLPDEYVKDLVAKVVWRLHNPHASVSTPHLSWMRKREADGWKYGPAIDPWTKEHPSMVPWDELPESVKLKDRMFMQLVLSMREP